MDRRNFFRILSTTGAVLAAAPVISASEKASGILLPKALPENNMNDILAIPRTKNSLPGLYPGKVILARNDNSVVDDLPQEAVAYEMLKNSMLALTGCKSLKKAWRKFVSPKEIIGLKVNPIGDKLLSTSHAVTKSVIKQLKESGIPAKNIIIWDRRQENLINAGYTADNYPDIRITSTEYMDEKGSMYGADGKLYGESRINKQSYFYADVEEEYDSYTMPYMINSGKNSYLTKIVTDEVDKIINIPILKNAGAAVTLCMKNLAFGSISNTGRLHKQFWHETCAIIPAFPAIRDKVVLNIADGLRGCFEGGPGANPQYICNYNLLLVGTDPVAVDRIGHDIVIKKRIQEGVQKADKASGYKYATLAESFGLGVADISKINLINI